MKERVKIFRHEKMMGVKAAIDAWLGAYPLVRIRRITIDDWYDYLTVMIAYEE